MTPDRREKPYCNRTEICDQKLATIMNSLDELKQMVHKTHHLLFGNGTEGIVEKQNKNTDFRLMLTRWFWIIGGVVTAGAVAFIWELIRT